MHVYELDTDNRRQVRRFLQLPFALYRNTPQWVPPLRNDAAALLDRRRHPFYQHSQAAFFLAESEGDTVGRLAVLDNRNYNEYNHCATAFFFLYECVDDASVSDSLFEVAFSWARQRGLTHLAGPRGFTALDGLGLLVKGFEHRPAFGIPYNLPYYASLIEGAGFASSVEIVSGYLNAGMAFPERIHRLSELVQQRRGLRIARYRTRRELLAVVPMLRDLYNASLGSGADNVPLSDAEVQTMAGQLVAYADPRLIKVVMKGEEPVGFLFAYPDVSAAVQRSHGRLLPFGWLDLLIELRRTKWVNVNGAGIVERYRGLGGTAILFSELAKSVIEGGFEHADLVQIGVENDKMQRELRDLGITFYKTHRMYRRAL